MEIFQRTYGRLKIDPRRAFKKSKAVAVSGKPVKLPDLSLPVYLLVDGYNIIFAWDDLRELAKVSIDGARGRLMDILCNYQGIRKCQLILVFDAYRVQGHVTELFDYHNIHVVYTKEAETADQYIEKFAHENGRKADVTVATSDGHHPGTGLCSAFRKGTEGRNHKGFGGNRQSLCGPSGQRAELSYGFCGGGNQRRIE